LIYLNPQCNGDLGSCGITVGTNTNIITDFLDLAQETELVNLDLDAQSYKVPAGSYKYLRVDLCSTTTGSLNNVAFEAPGMDDRHAFRKDNISSVLLSPDTPLVVVAGTTTKCKISYSLSNLVQIFDTAQQGKKIRFFQLTCF
jgi:hypothetical protein